MIDIYSLSPEGLIGVGIGCAMGYSFAMKTMLQVFKERLQESKAALIKQEEECQRHLEMRESRITRLEEKITQMQKAFWPSHDRRDSETRVQREIIVDDKQDLPRTDRDVRD